MTLPPVSGKQLCRLAESRKWVLVAEGEGVRVYRSPTNPKLDVMIRYTGWPLPSSYLRKFMRVLGLKVRDLPTGPRRR